MFTVTYNPVGGGAAITAPNIWSIQMEPQNDRGQTSDGVGLNAGAGAPQMVRLNSGIGGGGQPGGGFLIPLANITTITPVVI